MNPLKKLLYYLLTSLNSQRGFAQFLVLVLLVTGIGVGTYLVQQRTNLLPKAQESISCDDYGSDFCSTRHGQSSTCSGGTGGSFNDGCTEPTITSNNCESNGGNSFCNSRHGSATCMGGNLGPYGDGCVANETCSGPRRIHAGSGEIIQTCSVGFICQATGAQTTCVRSQTCSGNRVIDNGSGEIFKTCQDTQVCQNNQDGTASCVNKISEPAPANNQGANQGTSPVTQSAATSKGSGTTTTSTASEQSSCSKKTCVFSEGPGKCFQGVCKAGKENDCGFNNNCEYDASGACHKEVSCPTPEEIAKSSGGTSSEKTAEFEGIKLPFGLVKLGREDKIDEMKKQSKIAFENYKTFSEILSAINSKAPGIDTSKAQSLINQGQNQAQACIK